VTPFAACILDVDGVLVDSPHERAWRETLASLMEGPWRDLLGRSRWAPDRFTGAVYQRVVAGKPRLDGARAALEHFEDPDAARRAEEYAAVKQRRVEELIEAGRFTAFDDAVHFVLALRAAGIPLVAASSSRNADALLSRVPAGPGSSLLEHFAVDESGRAFAHGKPAPDIFLAAAADLGVPPAACVVVEDAPAGVRAAKAGGMGAIGVARRDDAGSLRAAGADLVVRSLSEVDVAPLASGVLSAANYGSGPPAARPTFG
jgi:beta-phosphoglucomutase